MKVLLVAHGYPPHSRGGTERSVESLARGLAREGHDVVVFAGTDHATDAAMTFSDRGAERPIRVLWMHRSDLYYEHWQKALSPEVGRCFESLLEAERPDVVHLHHWLRLSRDLVAHAARRGVPAVVTLHDYATTCLVVHRTRPDTWEPCSVPLAPDPCLACAAKVPPRTPWRPPGEQERELERWRVATRRELRLARAVLVLSRDQATALTRHLGGSIPLEVVPPGFELQAATWPPPPLPGPSTGAARTWRLASFGGIAPLKGIDLLVAALRRARAAGMDVELEIAGTTGDPAYLRKVEAESRGLPVRFHGPFGDGSLPDHPVAKAHLFVSGSRARETWNIAADEAVALRLPLVVPRAGAFVERYPEGRGALHYTQGDAASLAETLLRFERRPQLLLELRAALPSVAEVVGDARDFARRMVPIYERACRLGPPALAELDEPAGEGVGTDTEQATAIARWDAACSVTSQRDLGFT